MAEKTFPGESGGKRILTDETLRDLYENKGITMKKIAEQFGISFSRVQQRLAKMAVGKRKIHPLIDPESLRHMYCELRLTQAEIARKFDVTPRKVGYELAKYGIRLLRSSASQALLLSRETVVQAYIDGALPQREAARKLGVSIEHFRELLRYYQIEKRHHSGGRRRTVTDEEIHRLHALKQGSVSEIASLTGSSPSVIRRRLQRLGLFGHYRTRAPRLDTDVLRKLYLNDGLSIAKLAAQLNVSESTVRDQLDRSGIERRKFNKADASRFTTTAEDDEIRREDKSSIA